MPKDKYVSTEILLRRIIKSRGMDMKKITINRSTIYCNPRWIAAFARRADAMCSHWQHI
jgi:ABC-type nitrate/sulfonate/bicarbonate transport system substrate-binding protein